MKMNSDLLEATRLTREGRLTEATSVLQRMLHGTTSISETGDAGPTTQQKPDWMGGLIKKVRQIGGTLPGADARFPLAPADTPYVVPNGGRFVSATFKAEASAIAGIYGMNFHNIPEIDSPYGYFAVLGLMAVVAGGMLLVFLRLGWIGRSKG